MRCINLCLMAAAFAGPWCFAQSARQSSTTPAGVNPGYSIRVASPTSPIQLGSPCNIAITVKNITNKEIPWRSEFPDTAYRAFHIVLNGNAQEVETTPVHRRLRGEQRPTDPPQVESGGSLLSFIPPGKSVTFTVDLTRLYNITNPGQYKLDVSRIEDNNVVVHGNPVTLKFVP
jgi:hypothetical protein